MNEDALIALLHGTPLCRDLHVDEVARLVDEGRVEFWPHGGLLLEEGTPGTRLIVLLEGRVEISKADGDGDTYALAELGPGAVLGEVGLLLEAPRTASAKALEPLRIFTIERAAFQDMLAAGDVAAMKIGVALARALAARLARQNERLIDLMSEVADHRRRVEFLRANGEIERRWDY